MKEWELTATDCDMILESLRYTEQAFQEYPYYPSFKFKLQRIADVRSVIDKIQAMKRGRL